MRISQTRDQKIKAGLHAAQAFFIFIAGCLTLAVMTKSGGLGAEVLYFFGLCFLTIPALIYEVMVPMWTRAWRFANVYAYAVIDVLFAILWFAAFAAVASWNAAGIRKGEKEDTDSTTGKGTCSDFGYGSASKCETSKASIGFGVVVFLLFCLTSAMSIRAAMLYRRTGIMPNGSSKLHGPAEELGLAQDPNKDPWSTNTDELDADHAANSPFRNPSGDDRPAYGQIPQEDTDQDHGVLQHRDAEAQGLYHTTTHDGLHPGRQVSFGSEPSELSIAPPAYDEQHVAPSALSPGAFVQSPGGRVEFPQGRYSEAFT